METDTYILKRKQSSEQRDREHIQKYVCSSIFTTSRLVYIIVYVCQYISETSDLHNISNLLNYLAEFGP